MTDEEQTEPGEPDRDDDEPVDEPDDEPDDEADDTDGRVFSVYGVASTVLAILAVAAVALGALIFSAHRDDADERAYQERALNAAVEWTALLINLNSDNVDASMARLRDGTIGQLYADFDSAVATYPKVVQQLQARSSGQVEAVAIESARRVPDSPESQARLPAEMASRTDTVLVAATSQAENAGSDAASEPVRWDLRLDVSDDHGTLKISRLGWVR